MKAHVGADVDSGAMHTVEITAQPQHPVQIIAGGKRDYFWRYGLSDECKRGLRQLGVRWCVQDKRKPGQNLSGNQKRHNRKHSLIRALVEHVFSG